MTKLPVAVARDVALALNAAADRAMDTGDFELEVDVALCRRLQEAGLPELQAAIAAVDKQDG